MIKTRITEHRITFAPLFLARVNAGEHGQIEGMYDMEMPPEEVAECVEVAYEKLIFLGDAFPVFYMRPTGILGGYLGQQFGIDHQHGREDHGAFFALYNRPAEGRAIRAYASREVNRKRRFEITDGSEPLHFSDDQKQPQMLPQFQTDYRRM